MSKTALGSPRAQCLLEVVEWNGAGDSAGLMKEVTGMDMSRDKKVCEHPEKLKGKPGKCSPEQIKECHGQVAEHPCVRKK